MKPIHDWETSTADSALPTHKPEGDVAKSAPDREASERSPVAPESLRSFAEIIGQSQAVSRLNAIADLAKAKGAPAPHVLLTGPDGSGKRTLAGALAEELGSNLVATSGPEIEKPVDLMGILTNLKENDVLFIKEIHRLPRAAQGFLPPAMKDFSVDFVIDRGVNERTLKYALRPFTCIGAASTERDVPAAMKSLFPIAIALQPYSEEELTHLAAASCERHGFRIDAPAAALVARLSGGSPYQLRVLLQLLEGPSPLITSDYAADLLSRLGFGSAPMQGQAAADLMKLSGIEFERLIKSLLDRMGFATELTAITGDGGIDIVARLDQPIVGGRYLIQCKRFAEDAPVGAPTVREFYGAVAAHRAAIKGILITTSSFTAQAREFAADLRLELVDGQQLQQLLSAGRDVEITQDATGSE